MAVAKEDGGSHRMSQLEGLTVAASDRASTGRFFSLLQLREKTLYPV
jgi:hypothetical protein